MPRRLSEEELAGLQSGFRPETPKADTWNYLGSAVDSLQSNLSAIPAAAGSEFFNDLRLNNKVESQATRERYFQTNPDAARNLDEVSWGSAPGLLGRTFLDSLPTMGGIAAGGLVGGIPGAIAAASLAGTGDVLSNQYDEAGRGDLGTAIPLGLAYGSVDAMTGVGAAMLGRNMARTGIRGLDNLGAAGLAGIGGVGGMAARGAAATGKGFLVEGTGETLQEGFNQMGRMAVNPDQTLFNEDANKRYRDSFILGGALGGTVGLGGSVISSGPQRDQESAPRRPVEEQPDLIARTQGLRPPMREQTDLYGNLEVPPAFSPVNGAAPEPTDLNARYAELGGQLQRLDAAMETAEAEGNTELFYRLQDARDSLAKEVAPIERALSAQTANETEGQMGLFSSGEPFPAPQSTAAADTAPTAGEPLVTPPNVVADATPAGTGPAPVAPNAPAVKENPDADLDALIFERTRLKPTATMRVAAKRLVGLEATDSDAAVPVWNALAERKYGQANNLMAEIEAAQAAAPVAPTTPLTAGESIASPTPATAGVSPVPGVTKPDTVSSRREALAAAETTEVDGVKTTALPMVMPQEREVAIERPQDFQFRQGFIERLRVMEPEDKGLLEDWLGVRAPVDGDVEVMDAAPSLRAMAENYGVSHTQVMNMAQAALERAGAPEGMNRKMFLERLGGQLGGASLAGLTRNTDVSTPAADTEAVGLTPDEVEAAEAAQVVAKAEATATKKATENDGAAPILEDLPPVERGTDGDVAETNEDGDTDFAPDTLLEQRRNESPELVGELRLDKALSDLIKSKAVLPSDVAEAKALYTSLALENPGLRPFSMLPVSQQVLAVSAYARERVTGKISAQDQQRIKDTTNGKTSTTGGAESAARNSEAVRPGADPTTEQQGSVLADGTGVEPAADQVREAGSQAQAPAVQVKTKRALVKPADTEGSSTGAAPTRGKLALKGAKPAAQPEAVAEPEAAEAAPAAKAPLRSPSNFRGAATATVGTKVDATAGPRFGPSDVLAKPAPEAAVEPEVVDEVALAEPAARQATTAEMKDTDGVAKNLGGIVVWQRGDLALVRGFNMMGRPTYVVARGAYYLTMDVDGSTGNFKPARGSSSPQPITETQRTELRAEKARLEALDAQKHAADPFISFDGGNIQVSADMPAGMAGIAQQWAKLLGLNANIYITSIEEARANKDKYTGPHRAVASGTLSANENGSMRRMADGSYYVLFRQSTSKTKMLEVLAHELGHVHQKEVFDNADATTKAKIIEAHATWVKSQSGQSSYALVRNLRAKTTGQTTRTGQGQMASDMGPYWTSFSEWYADQVSRWAVSSEKPVGVVEQFFKKLGAALQKFYFSLKGKGFLPNETMKAYLDNIAEAAGRFDAQFSKADESAGSTVADITASIQAFMRVGALGRKVIVVQAVADLPAGVRRSVGINTNTQAFVINGKAYLIAGQIAPGKARSVFLHEVGAHLGMENILGDYYDTMVDRIVDWAGQNDGSQESKLAIAALRRVRAANTSDAQANTELVAYFIEEAVDAGITPTGSRGPVATMLRRFMEAFKKAFLRLEGNPDKLTPKDFVDMAYGAAQMELKAGGATVVSNPAFSKALATQTAAFKKWFGGSKVVDEDGQPLVVYHGTDKDFDEFKKGQSANFRNPQRLLGYFFAPDAEYASQYGSKTMEVYLSINNPFYAPSSRIDSIENGSDRSARAWVKSLRDKGYDGIKFGNGVTAEWVAFNPTQIKSATGNNGNFDGTDPRISFSQAAPIRTGNAQLDALPEKAANIMRWGGDVGADVVKKVAFTRDLLAIAAKNGITSALEYGGLMDTVAVERGRHERALAKTWESFQKLSKAEKGTGPNSVNAVLKDATMKKVWPFKPDWVINAVYDENSAQAVAYRALTPEGQKVVENVFRSGHNSLQEMRTLVLNTVASEYDALIAAAKEAGDAKEVKALQDAKLAKNKRISTLLVGQRQWPYAPLKRFGRFAVVGTSERYRALADELKADPKNRALRESLEKLQADGAHYYVAFAETNWAGRKMAREVERETGLQTGHFERMDDNNMLDGGRDMQTAMLKVRNLVEALPDSTAAMNKLVTQAYIQMLSDTSVRKAELERKNTAGADNDMMRSFISNGRAQGHFIAGLKTNGKVTELLRKMRTETRDVRGHDARAGAQAAFVEIERRHRSFLEYKDEPFIDNLMSMTSGFLLLSNPSYFLLNATQPMVMSLPVLSGKFGGAKSAAALTQAYKDIIPALKGGTFSESDYALLPDDVKLAIEELANLNKINISLASEMGQARSSSPGVVQEKLQRVSETIRGVAETVEATNRLTTAIAAYRLAREARSTHAEAVKYAETLLNDTHGDYTSFNAPRFMRSGVPRLMTQFRKFQLIQATHYVKLIAMAFKGDTKEDRKLAAKILMFNLHTMVALGGVMALPGATAIAFLMGSVLGLGEDDEPDDPEATLRRMIGDKDTANLLLKGVPAWLGMDVSARIGAGGALSLLPYVDPELSRAGYSNLVTGALGPALGGVGPRLADAAGMFTRGEFWKGSELLLPGALGNSLKAMRASTDGLTTRNGDMTLSPDDVGFLQGLAVAFGTPTSVVTDRNRLVSSKFKAEKFYNARTSSLKREYSDAVRDGDTLKTRELREDWMQVQAARKRLGFESRPLSDLLKAPADRRKREASNVGGVATTKSNVGFVTALQ